MTATRTCAECKSPLPLGVPDLFCPACAFRLAIAGGQSTSPPLRPVRSFNPATWFRRWRHRTQVDGSRQFALASAKNKHEESPAMAGVGVTPAPGDVIEDYEILEKIGGNMGQVFRARHRLLNKIVALKLLPSEWIADPARLARFQREMRVLGQLEHPHLVTAADARSVDSWHLVAMEWIDGVDLHQLVRNHGPLPVA